MQFLEVQQQLLMPLQQSACQKLATGKQSAAIIAACIPRHKDTYHHMLFERMRYETGQLPHISSHTLQSVHKLTYIVAICPLFEPIITVAPGFQAYEGLTRYQRADLVQSASNCLSAWMAMANPSLVNRQLSTSPPSAQTQALASVSVAEQQQQLDDRRSSSMTASTSQAASKPAAFSTATAAASTGTGSTFRQPFRAQSAYSNASPGLDSLHEVALNGVSQQAPAEDTSAGLPAEQTSKHPVSTAGVPLSQLLADPLKVLGEEPDPIASQHASSLSTAESLVPDTSSPSASDCSLHSQHTDKDGTPHPTKHGELDSVPHDSAFPLSSAAQPEDPSHDQPPSSQGSAGKKAKRPELLAFETSFAQAAAAAEAADTRVDVEAGGQLSEEWHALRQGRLTASTFANALG